MRRQRVGLEALRTPVTRRPHKPHCSLKHPETGEMTVEEGRDLGSNVTGLASFCAHCPAGGAQEILRGYQAKERSCTFSGRVREVEFFGLLEIWGLSPCYFPEESQLPFPHPMQK